ncbi:hypothetical protein U9M48_043496 [Paspalum notatum var. saurae]|uniref:Uncharacterized protein n=1 Tax=Paspalum notatum var. saurae TaxID=547442 RepID=A0AAQ3UV23_PASNO
MDPVGGRDRQGAGNDVTVGRMSPQIHSAWRWPVGRRGGDRSDVAGVQSRPVVAEWRAEEAGEVAVLLLLCKSVMDNR